jgi:hypothetical protein
VGEHRVGHARHGRRHYPEAEHANYQPYHVTLFGRHVDIEHECPPRQPEGKKQQGVETKRRRVQFDPEHMCQSRHAGHCHQVEEELGPARMSLDQCLLGFVGSVQIARRVTLVFVSVSRFRMRGAGGPETLGVATTRGLEIKGPGTHTSCVLPFRVEEVGRLLIGGRRRLVRQCPASPEDSGDAVTASGLVSGSLGVSGLRRYWDRAVWQAGLRHVGTELPGDSYGPLAVPQPPWSNYRSDLRWSAKTLWESPYLVFVSLGLVVLFDLSVRQVIRPRGVAGVLDLAVEVFLVGFVGAQRVWFLRKLRGVRFEAAEVWTVPWRFFGRFLCLDLLGIILLIPIAIAVAVATAHHHARTT